VTTLAASLVGLTVIGALLSIVWLLSLRLRDASIIDICRGPGFVLLAWLYCGLLGDSRPRPVWVAVLITLWGGRLGVHLYRRHRRVGEDFRYRAMRLAHGRQFWWRSLVTIFWLQAGILWFVALPVLMASRVDAPDSVTFADVVGLALFLAGFVVEAISDDQLTRFRAAPSNRGLVLDAGLWRYSRHPNYVGDAVVWWGVYAIAASTPGGWLTALSPAVMTFLLRRVSGVTLLFFPWPPRDVGESPERKSDAPVR
jgi:steroid 5-alpha reductase family enzyme